MIRIGSISTESDGSKTIYVDYNDKTKKVICSLFKWKNLTQKRLVKLLLGTMDYKKSTDEKFGLDKPDGLQSHLLITHHKAFDNVKVKRVKKYKPTKQDKDIIANVSNWMVSTYGDKLQSINLPDIKFSTALQRSEYSNITGITISKGTEGKARDKFIWRIYDDNPVRVTTGKTGIECSEEEFTTLNMIHEMTHYLQDINNQELDESEPTVNELDYCQAYYPHLFEKLGKVEDTELTEKEN